MNGFQIKQRNRIIDPTRHPTRRLTAWEKQFQDFLRTVPDGKELTVKQNSKLNDLAALFTGAGK